MLKFILYFVVDGGAANEYGSLSTSPTSAPTSATSVDETHTSVVKMEAVDISSDNECNATAQQLCFNDEQMEGETTAPEVRYF